MQNVLGQVDHLHKMQASLELKGNQIVDAEYQHVTEHLLIYTSFCREKPKGAVWNDSFLRDAGVLMLNISDHFRKLVERGEIVENGYGVGRE